MMIRLIGLLCVWATLAPVVGAREPAADVPVIDSLEVSALPAGRHHFYFRAGWLSTGMPIHVPVVVLKGAEPGKRLLLTAAVHGDELNGIGVIHRLLEQLDAGALSGTLVAVPGVNQLGMAANNRRFPVSAGGGSYVDLNRNFPGTDEDTGPTAERFLGGLWQNLIKDNADMAVDIHTQTRGTAYPLFVFADFGNALSQQAAFLLGPDMIKNDPGQKGTLETSLMKAGIPAVTLEVGAPKVFQADLIARAVSGIKNLMRAHKMLDGEAVMPPMRPIVGSSYTNVYTETGGVAVLHVGLKDRVEKGQHVATLYDPFGQELKRYTAPHDGWVLAVATDPLREAGTMLVRILQ
ncbi:MAG: succinylglutamate desuccinylase/aspartoacylase family protein [Alphaproteobacteria bacterium]|nr:succinylglutamate desuccinylase/aspartoacylase family protein [Alphaproteobacteria bacterium]